MIFHETSVMMNLTKYGSDVTGDVKWGTTVEHRTISAGRLGKEHSR